MVSTDIAQEWSPARRARAADRLAQMRQRADIVNKVSHPAELAASCDMNFVRTPAIDLISKSVEQVLRGRRRRLMITMGPQEGKSWLCAVWTPLRALQLHPNWRVMLLTYADGLAEKHSLLARSFLQEYGSTAIDAMTGTALPDRLGISLSSVKATAGNWSINEGVGGLFAAGREATITGRQADLLIIDDPFKGMTEADSLSIRSKVDMWYRSVALTRLSPEAGIILMNTRWHPEDLSGTILAEEAQLPEHKREWRYINIPAVSHPSLPDALNRPPGVPLESTRGRTPADWEAIERSAGKRVWNALYQGSPVPPEGGLFSALWFDEHRIDVMPDRTRVRIVAVDPAESGKGDEAGVIGAALLSDGRVVLTHDRSAQMTSDQWARAAVDLALETDAAEIVVEAYTAGLTYIEVVRRNITDRLRLETDPRTIHQLTALRNRVRKWRGTGDAVARSGLIRQAIEVGTCVVLGHEMTEMEMQAIQWQQGSHQPDRVAAAVIVHDRLVEMMGRQAQIATPITNGNRSRPTASWLERKVG